MNRREAAIGLGGLGGLLGLAPALANAATKSGGAPGSVQALYARAMVVDANLSPPLQVALPLPKAALDTVRASGVTVCKTTLGGFNNNFEDTVGEIALVQATIEAHPDVFLQVRKAADFALAKRTGRVGIIFSFEGADMHGGKLDNIDVFRWLGVRVMQLSYNKTSPFASGVMADPTAGLTDLGKQAVERMNAVGVAIDLSHASPATTDQTIALSKKPVLITHAGCAAVHPHPRNKTDAQLRAVVAKGGVVGIYDLPYLAAPPKQPDVEVYMAHMTHALSVCGEDHVGIGSDQGMEPFDTSPEGIKRFKADEDERQKAGVAALEEDYRFLFVEGMNVPNRCEIIAGELLKRGYPARVAEKVLGLNFARGFPAAWGE
jgi:membrane dipeptidase